MVIDHKHKKPEIIILPHLLVIYLVWFLDYSVMITIILILIMILIILSIMFIHKLILIPKMMTI